MIRNKTLYLPLVCALIASATLPADAQLRFALSSRISYRQDKKDVRFTGGDFVTLLSDGSAALINGCEWYLYYPPGSPGICNPGTTGLISRGTIDGVKPTFPYVIVTSIFPAFTVAPRKPASFQLVAAPPSELPRPASGFTDNSVSIFYDLTAAATVKEYNITSYSKRLAYGVGQRDKFQSEIVPGVYYYAVPLLADPNRTASISAVIYPMLEGRQELNNTVEGFEYTEVNKNKWTNNGFVEMDFLRPNSINWAGAIPATVFPSDILYFSIKSIRDPKDPKSPVVDEYAGIPISIFPPFQNGGEPRVLLDSPYVSNFTTPPIFDGGTTGVVQIDLVRSLQTGGVTYDFSTRTFEIPVVVVNRYSEYTTIAFPNSSKGSAILEDPDKDGYNNLNEWILGSSASEATSIPIAPVPGLATPVDPIFGLPSGFAYYGFDVKKRLNTVPDVAYTLQRSKDGGKTWAKFTTDNDWFVETVRTAPIANIPATVTIQVRSLVVDALGIPIQPPGTAPDIYRVKITLKK